jgi:hypothetical protein
MEEKEMKITGNKFSQKQGSHTTKYFPYSDLDHLSSFVFSLALQPFKKQLYVYVVPK